MQNRDDFSKTLIFFNTELCLEKSQIKPNKLSTLLEEKKFGISKIVTEFLIMPKLERYDNSTLLFGFKYNKDVVFEKIKEINKKYKQKYFSVFLDENDEKVLLYDWRKDTNCFHSKCTLDCLELISTSCNYIAPIDLRPLEIFSMMGGKNTMLCMLWNADISTLHLFFSKKGIDFYENFKSYI
jgi:hypothetical protein